MKYIAYYRVSTQRQGQSQLGLMAQRESVKRFIDPNLIFKEFTEIETGTNKKVRPILNEALALCKELDATLIIAKLDRLSRNVAFVSSLLDSKVKFQAVDIPGATDLTIQIMAAIAQNEAKVISTRIKDALAIKREILAKKGKKLGTPENLTNEARIKGLEIILTNRLNNENRIRAIELVKGLNYNGMKLREIAAVLNSKKFKTANGKEFHPTQVSRLIKSIEKEKNQCT